MTCPSWCDAHQDFEDADVVGASCEHRTVVATEPVLVEMSQLEDENGPREIEVLVARQVVVSTRQLPALIGALAAVADAIANGPHLHTNDPAGRRIHLSLSATDELRVLGRG